MLGLLNIYFICKSKYFANLFDGDIFKLIKVRINVYGSLQVDASIELLLYN